jgi:hypothetical protein
MKPYQTSNFPNSICNEKFLALVLVIVTRVVVGDLEGCPQLGVATSPYIGSTYFSKGLDMFLKSLGDGRRYFLFDCMGPDQHIFSLQSPHQHF